MKALQIVNPGKIRRIEMEKPVPQAGEVLLKLNYVGFCGSDLNTFRGRNAMAKPEVIPGHEVGATIEAFGEGVPDSLKPGMNVTVNPYTNCGVCPSCRNMRYNACENNETLGVQRDGAMREYFCLPWGKIIPAEGLSAKETALVEPMSVGFHAVARAMVAETDTVMVIGCGMVGLGAVVGASSRGARVIAADIDKEKLELSKQMGASYVLDTTDASFHKNLREITGGNGPDVIIEAVGSPATYRLAIDEVAFTGRVTFIGYSKSEVCFDTSLFVKKELDIRGSRNATPSDFEAVINYLKRGTCPTGRLISDIVSYETAQKAMEYWSENPGKVFRILLDTTDTPHR